MQSENELVINNNYLLIYYYLKFKHAVRQFVKVLIIKCLNLIIIYKEFQKQDTQMKENTKITTLTINPDVLEFVRDGLGCKTASKALRLLTEAFVEQGTTDEGVVELNKKIKESETRKTEINKEISELKLKLFSLEATREEEVLKCDTLKEEKKLVLIKISKDSIIKESKNTKDDKAKEEVKQTYLKWLETDPEYVQLKEAGLNIDLDSSIEDFFGKHSELVTKLNFNTKRKASAWLKEMLK